MSSSPSFGGTDLLISLGVVTSPDFTLFTPSQQLQAISDLFREYCSTHSSVVIPNDFLKMTVSAMEQLKYSGRSNVVYRLSMALGTKREDQTDSLLRAHGIDRTLCELFLLFLNSSG